MELLPGRVGLVGGVLLRPVVRAGRGGGGSAGRARGPLWAGSGRAGLERVGVESGSS